MNRPHISIEIPEQFPEEFDEFILTDLVHEKLNLDFRRSGPKMYAALEWVIPGLIATYILKPYFEAFLKEAGKDHYQILKKKMSTLLSTAKQMNVKKVAASKSTEKLDSSNSQSGAISIFIETKSGHLIKLLYDNNLDLETWQKSTNQFLDLMESHYENGNGDPISKYLMQVSKEKSGREIFAIIDPETKDWMLIHNISQYIKDKKNRK
ncbi:MAG: hypothetical protein A2W95_17115 [Bacteroidetes bacterium GWA2_40_14]|nr:MAG: hypothetical protein A2W95_17115 [Bacteroidetes bacterium GWA2_40_14]